MVIHGVATCGIEVWLHFRTWRSCVRDCKGVSEAKAQKHASESGIDGQGSVAAWRRVAWSKFSIDDKSMCCEERDGTLSKF